MNSLKNNKIIFLGKDDAFLEFRKSPYPYKLQKLEMKVRLNCVDPKNNNALNIYKNNLTDFTDFEVKTLRWYVQTLCQIMQDRANNYFPKVWKFIKMKNGLDWNLPYTINDCIVLPVDKIREMVTAKCHQIPDLIVSGLKLIFHELVHIDQRCRPQIYQKIYHDLWDFMCVAENNIHLSPFYKQYRVTNPDALQRNFIIPIIQPGTNLRTDYFLPYLILDPKDIRKQKGILIKLNQVYNQATGENEYFTTSDYRTICSLKEYTQKFYGMDKQLDHPNEIIAHLLSDYVVTFKAHSNNAAILKNTKFYFITRKLLNGLHPQRLCYY